MGFSAQQMGRLHNQVNAFLAERRPPAEIRDQLDLGYRIEGQSILLFEIRPRFRAPSQKQEVSIAKGTYVRSKSRWNVYWMRADLKWHRYKPAASVPSLRAFLEEVDRDTYGCFWG
jgi:hypothetical protein